MSAQVSGVVARGRVLGETTATSGSSASDPTALLPPPMFAMDGVQDGLAVALLLQNQVMQADLKDTSMRSLAQQKKNDALLKSFQDAMRRQASAEKKSRGFWSKLKKACSTVAKIAGLVAGVAAVVGTGGAAGPMAIGIAGVALSAGGTAVRELKLLGKDSDKIGLFMELGGAGVGIGGAALAAAGVISAAANASATANAVGVGANLTQSGAMVTVGASTVAIADFQRDADHAAADREDAQLSMDRVSWERRMILESAKEGVEASQEAVDATRSAIEATYRFNDTMMAGWKA